MKNDKKKSPTMKIVSAAAMLAVSAAMLSTSTYAWFTMNKEVKVQNLSVQAKAEGGLLISEVAGVDGEWDDVANTTAEVDMAVGLFPTSTANGVTWYHATSKRANDAAAATSSGASALKASGYDELTLSAAEIQAASSGQNGKKEKFSMGSGTEAADYYVKYTYYLKASNETGLDLGTGANAQNVMISEVTATGMGGSGSGSGSAELDKSLRVGIAMGDKFYIFAPVDGATGTYYVAGATETNAIDSHASHDATTDKGTMTEVTALDSLPGRSEDGTPVYIYMWFEGEDAACKSDNITALLDTLTVNVEFKLATLDAAGTDNGVEMT